MNVIVKRMMAGAALVAAVACGGAKESTPPATTAPAATTPAATMGGAAATVADGDFGVPECDSFLKKYYACIDANVPEAARPMVRQQVDMMKAAWKQTAAANASNRSAMADACRQAETAAKQSMAAYNCTW
jgi:hypothetical protein